MEGKSLFFVNAICLLVLSCSDNQIHNPRLFFSNNQDKIRSIATLYEKLDSVAHFELFFIGGRSSDVQIFWTAEKTYKTYNEYQQNSELRNFIDSNGMDINAFYMLANLMKKVKCRYVSKSYLKANGIYYLILGFNSKSLAKDLQFIFFTQDEAKAFYKNSRDVNQIDDGTYFRYSKAPGD